MMKVTYKLKILEIGDQNEANSLKEALLEGKNVQVKNIKTLIKDYGWREMSYPNIDHVMRSTVIEMPTGGVEVLPIGDYGYYVIILGSKHITPDLPPFEESGSLSVRH